MSYARQSGMGETTTLDFFGMDLPKGGDPILVYPTTGGASVDDYLRSWAGNEGVTTATPAEQDAARRELLRIGQPAAAGFDVVKTWLEANKTAVYVGAAVLVGLAFFRGRR